MKVVKDEWGSGVHWTLERRGAGAGRGANKSEPTAVTGFALVVVVVRGCR